jgi:hypothetical protein
MRRTMLFGVAFLIVFGGSMSVAAQALSIDSIEPQSAEPGTTVRIRGSLGLPERGKAIRFARVVDRRTEIYYPTLLRWTRDEAEVSIPRNLPADRYLVTVVYPDRPTRHSNNFILTIREPAPPAQAGRSDSPVVVLANRCMSRSRNRTSRSTSEYEISTGGIYAACETMRTINDENTPIAFPGGEITITGDFGNPGADRHVALAKFVEVYSERQRRTERRLNVTHLLKIVAWSPNRVRIRIGERVRPDDYLLLILNRLSARVVPGIFEQGSNVIQVRVRPIN